jgi:hypothetical protein
MGATPSWSVSSVERPGDLCATRSGDRDGRGGDFVVTMRTLWERWSGSGSRASGDNAEPYLMYFCQVVEVEG